MFIGSKNIISPLLQVDSQGAKTAKDSHCDTDCHKKLHNCEDQSPLHLLVDSTVSMIAGYRSMYGATDSITC